MARVWTYMTVMLTMMIFLFFLGYSPSGVDATLAQAGIVINATTGELVTGDISNSDWADLLFNAPTSIKIICYYPISC